MFSCETRWLLIVTLSGASEQPVVLFAAADNEKPYHLKEEWELHTGYGVDIVRVAGRTMLRKPHVSILAQSLEHLLASFNSEDHYAVVKDRE
jgi:hypothetical protein